MRLRILTFGADSDLPQAPDRQERVDPALQDVQGAPLRPEQAVDRELDGALRHGGSVAAILGSF